MLDITATGKVSAFLDAFGAALAAGNVDAVTNMFEDDCYWRDLVTFTWNIKTMEGKAEIADMLRNQLAACKPSNWQIAEGESASEEGGVITAWISFETAVARGYGLIRLRSGKMGRSPPSAPGWCTSSSSW